MTSQLRNQIDDWQDAIFAAGRDGDHLTRPLSEEQFNWRPAPGKWSVGECFSHLNIATGLMLEQVKPVVERGRVERIHGVPPFRYQMMGGWFVKMMEKPPGKRGMPAPRNFVPPSGLPKVEVMTEYARVIADLRTTIDGARGLALDKLRAGSAAQGGSWLKFNLAAWFAATVAHLQRHLAQATRVTQSQGFPGSA